MSKQIIIKRKALRSSQDECDKPLKKLKTAKIPATQGLLNMVWNVNEIVPPHIDLTPPGDTKSLNKHDSKETSPSYIALLITGPTLDKLNPKKVSIKPNKRFKITDFFNCASNNSCGDTSSENVEKYETETANENQTFKAIESSPKSNNDVKLLRILNENILEFVNTERKVITAEKLDLSYFRIFNKRLGDKIFQELEKQMEYFTGDLTKVNINGQWKDIPRKQVAYGNEGLTYSFSGNTLPAKPWVPLLEFLRRIVSDVAKADYNFVLINRYNSGQDHIGEHRDDEPDLDHDVPIASLSFGQQREFLLRHKDLKFKRSTLIPEQRIQLEHGSLLLMHYPTNFFWYHSLPKCSTHYPRINLTFRKILKKSEQTPNFSNNLGEQCKQAQSPRNQSKQEKNTQWQGGFQSPYQRKKIQWQQGSRLPDKQEKKRQW